MSYTPAFPTISSPFNAKSTAEEVSSNIDLSGKIALVTGGTKGGLGYETARVLALRGAHVFITARDEKKGSEAVAELIKQTGNKKIEFLVIRLDDLNNVREGLKPFVDRNLPLHILILNAGVNDSTNSTTAQGFNLMFGVNHLSHFYLTQLLLPQLKSAKSARIVVVSSVAAHWPERPKNGESLDWNRTDWKKDEALKAYGQSKLANVYFANELDRRYKEDGIRAFSLHPGTVVTNMLAAIDVETMKSFGAILPDGSYADWVKNLAEGAATSVFAAVSPLLNGLGGLYLENSAIAQIYTDEFKGAAPFFYDEEEERKLWEQSEKFIGSKA